jgi:4-hydroxy-3-polyprenylbenzoate decarboxylase
MGKRVAKETRTEIRNKKKSIIVGITGASGIIYGIRFVEILAKMNYEVYVIISDAAKKVGERENDIDIFHIISKITSHIFSEKDIDAPPSSSSFTVTTKGMAIIPCSIKTLAEISNGITSNLISRSAINMIRTKKRLVLVIRETPLGPLELRNALKLSNLGAIILPASPGFYTRPKTIDDIIDFIVGKTLDSLGISNDVYKRWIR